MGERVLENPKIEHEDASHLQEEPKSFDFITEKSIKIKYQKPEKSEDKPSLFNSRSELGECGSSFE